MKSDSANQKRKTITKKMNKKNGATTNRKVLPPKCAIF